MMVNLFEPDGTLNRVCTKDYAILYCRDHPGWYWAEI